MSDFLVNTTGYTVVGLTGIVFLWMRLYRHDLLERLLGRNPLNPLLEADIIVGVCGALVVAALLAG